MAKLIFVVFAVLCGGQRYLEMRRHDRRLTERRGHWTAPAMLALHTAILVAAVVEVFLVSRPLRPGLLALGGGLFLAGFLLRRWVIRSMRDLWSIDVERLEGHRLLTTGPFAWCRHPNYLAILLEIGGYCLIGQAFYTLAVGLPLYAVLLTARIVAEERVLVSLFGDDYRRYRRRRAALLPIGGLPAWVRRGS